MSPALIPSSSSGLRQEPLAERILDAFQRFGCAVRAVAAYGHRRNHQRAVLRGLIRKVAGAGAAGTLRRVRVDLMEAPTPIASSVRSPLRLLRFFAITICGFGARCA